MADVVYKPKVGQFVYFSYRPQSPGIVTHVAQKPIELIKGGKVVHVSPWYGCRIKWLNSDKETEENSNGLRDFSSLIADHEKKLNTHLNTNARLKELQARLNWR